MTELVRIGLQGALEALQDGVVEVVGTAGLEAVYSEELCPECGWDGDWSNVQIEVEWKDLDGGEGPKEERPQFCSACGHQWQYVITWRDLPNEGERCYGA